MIEAPALLLHVAAQFVHPDKGAITDIHLKSMHNGVRIGATNGHFAFRCLVPFGPLCFMQSPEALIPAKAFKKKVAYAQKAIINNGEARFYGGKKEGMMDLLEARPCVDDNKDEFPSHFDSLWPDPASMANAPAKPIVFNSEYMRTICDIGAKLADSVNIKMRMGESPTSPMLLTTGLDDIELQFLLLPVMVRD